MTGLALYPRPELHRRLAQLEAEISHLREVVDMLRHERAELVDWQRQEARRCSRR